MSTSESQRQEEIAERNAGYADYLRERQASIELECKQAESFDRWILTLSGGALAITMTFVKEFAPSGGRVDVHYLLIGWASFAASMCSTLLSFLASQRGHQRLRCILDEQFKRGSIDQSNHWGRMTAALNLLSMLLFFVGILCVAVFVLRNA